MNEDVIQGRFFAAQRRLEVRGRADGGHPAQMHDRHPLAQVVCFLHEVGGHHNGSAKLAA